ncbi:hypothetical protein AAMO2058_001435300 [Amorphochlora amoebiformis]
MRQMPPSAVLADAGGVMATKTSFEYEPSLVGIELTVLCCWSKLGDGRGGKRIPSRVGKNNESNLESQGLKLFNFFDSIFHKVSIPSTRSFST